MYRDYYEQLKAEISRQLPSLQTLTSAYALAPAGPKLFSEFCSYEELLQNPKLSQAEDDRVRKHILTLMNRRSHQ